MNACNANRARDAAKYLLQGDCDLECSQIILAHQYVRQLLLELHLQAQMDTDFIWFFSVAGLETFDLTDGNRFNTNQQSTHLLLLLLDLLSLILDSCILPEHNRGIRATRNEVILTLVSSQRPHLDAESTRGQYEVTASLRGISPTL